MATIMDELANVEPQKQFNELFQYLQMQYEQRRIPMHGTFELTPHCNLDCKMCYIHRSDGKYPHRVLTGDEWLDIMDQAIDMGMLRATLTGGECLLHPDFKRIYTHLKQKGVYVSVKTNGVALDDEMLRFFVDFPPIGIQISVYGSSPEVYEKVTGNPDAFYKVDLNLKRLKAYKIPYGITLTISRYNFDDYQRLYKYVTSVSNCKIAIDAELFEPHFGGQYSSTDFNLSLEEYEDVHRRYIEWTFGKTMSSNLSNITCAAEALFDRTMDYPRTMPCTAGITSFHITYFGVMLPCLDFYLERVDLEKESFRNAWKKINNASVNYRRSAECSECEFLGNCLFCPARYSQETQGEKGLPGSVKCNKNVHIVLPLLNKQLKRDQEDRRIMYNEKISKAADDNCKNELF